MWSAATEARRLHVVVVDMRFSGRHGSTKGVCSVEGHGVPLGCVMMRISKWLVLLAVFSLSTGVAPAVASPPGSVMTFSSLDPQEKHSLHATLYLPDDGSARHPAIVVIHGTAWNSTADALVKVDPNRFEIIDTPNYWRGIDY
jgi:hypothetical protein